MITKQSLKRKPLALRWTFLLLGGVVVLIVLFFILQAKHLTHFFAHPNDQTQITQYNHSKKENTISTNGNPASAQGDKGSTQSSYTPPNSPSNITLTPKQPSSDQVVISTKLSGYSDGTCSLAINNGSKHTTLTADVIYAPDFSTCAGFTLAPSTLGNGVWQFSLTVTSGGVSTTQSSSLDVK